MELPRICQALLMNIIMSNLLEHFYRVDELHDLDLFLIMNKLNFRLVN